MRTRGLSDSGEILGLTAYEDAEIAITRYFRQETIRVARNTGLLDERLQPTRAYEDAELGRRHYTLAHECAHQILYRAAPCGQRYSGRAHSLRETASRDDLQERQANALAAVLLIPPQYATLLVRRYAGTRRLVAYGKRFNIPDALVLDNFCAALGVSRAATVIRLRQLGYLEDRPRSAFFDPVEIICDEPDA
ncbi:MAG: ImmA/IrrE family metallo-endopeptidase [Oscillospiraceae bacterium]|nr:ImmA/IrrE family metallo-endopeptidase [Oscillospiraceae bacterium]